METQVFQVRQAWLVLQAAVVGAESLHRQQICTTCNLTLAGVVAAGAFTPSRLVIMEETGQALIVSPVELLLAAAAVGWALPDVTCRPVLPNQMAVSQPAALVHPTAIQQEAP